MREKRTEVDFSKHIVETTFTENCLVHYIRLPKTVTNSVKFINTNGIMAVTGDYGNWIFNREFHPSTEACVSDSYWIEKLQIASSQQPYDYDSIGTRKKIEEMLKKDDLSEEEKEYFENLFNYVDNDFEYKCHAFNSRPPCVDYESIPYCREPKYWLNCIFDAFDEICRRLKG